MRQFSKLATVALVISCISDVGAQGVVRSAHWGPGQLFVRGVEIVQPVHFSGFGTSAFAANDVSIDPSSCGVPLSDETRSWCATTPRRRNLPSDPIHLWDVQERFVQELKFASHSPLVAIGCGYFYCPDEREGLAVLMALEAGAFKHAINLGAPELFVDDYRESVP